jgi:hypothetical protein
MYPNEPIDLDFLNHKNYQKFLKFQYPLEEEAKILCNEMLKFFVISLNDMLRKREMLKLLLGLTILPNQNYSIRTVSIYLAFFIT